MNQTISLFLLISILSLQYQSSQSSLQVTKVLRGQANLGVRNYLFIDETRAGTAKDQQITIFGWIKFSHFHDSLNPILKLSLANNQDKMYQDLENFVLLSYDQPNKKIDLIYQKEKNQGKLHSYKYYMSKDQWAFVSIGLDFQKNKIQLYISQKNDISEANISKELDLNFAMEVPPKFTLSLGCFPVNYIDFQNVQSLCSIGTVKDFGYINSYVDNASLLFMLDDDYLLVNNYVFDGENQQNQVIFPKGQRANSFLLTGNTQYEQVGESQMQIFSGENQLKTTGLILSSDRVSTSSTFTVYMNMSFRNPTEQMTLAQLTFSNGLKLKVEIKKGNGFNYYLDFSIRELGFQFSTNNFMKPQHVSKFAFTFVREGQLFWIIFVGQNQKLKSFKIPIGDVLSTEFQVLDAQENKKFTQFRFFRLATTNQSSGAIVNYMGRVSSHNKCELELGESKKEDRCLSCKHGYVMLPSTSKCERHCPFGYQNILGNCMYCTGGKCEGLSQKFFDIKKIAYDTFVVTLLNPIYTRNLKIEDLFYVDLLDEKLGDDYALNKQLLSKNPYTIQYNFIYRDLKKQHMVEFKLRNEHIYSISRNAIPRQIVYFNSATLGTDPLKEDFLLQNNMQTNSNRYSFMKRPVKRDQNITSLENASLDDQLNFEIQRADDYLLQKKLEDMFENPGIIPMELPKMDSNNCVGDCSHSEDYLKQQNFMQLQPRIQSNKNIVYQPIAIAQQETYNLDDFKQTQTQLPFVYNNQQQIDNKFYEQDQVLPKIDGRQEPIEIQTQQDRVYFYPLDSRIKNQTKKEVIELQPQNLDQQVFYPKPDQLDGFLMRKIKRDKQNQQNNLFFYPVEDRLKDGQQFLKNFPLLEQDPAYLSNQQIKSQGLNMLQQHDQRQQHINKLRKEYKDYKNQIQMKQTQQPDIVEQYRQHQTLQNVFDTYEQQQKQKQDQQQLERQYQTLQNVFNLHDYQQKQKQDQQKLERQYQTLQNVFNLHNLQNQQNQTTLQNYNAGFQDQTEFQPYYQYQTKPQKTFQAPNKDFKLYIKTAQPQQEESQKEEKVEHPKKQISKWSYYSAKIAAITTYIYCILGLLFGVLKFFLNSYNKQAFSTISLLKVAQILLFMQYFSFQYFILKDMPPILHTYLEEVKKLFLDSQVIWLIHQGHHYHDRVYNLFKNHDMFAEKNLSNLFLQNYSLMILLLSVFIVIYLIMQFISRTQQKKAMDNYIQEGHYKLKSGHYKLALLLEQFRAKILPLIILGFGLEISMFAFYNLLYVKCWSGRDLFSFLVSILFIVIFLYCVFSNLCVKRSKSKKIQKKFKRTNSTFKKQICGVQKLKIFGWIFFLMGILNLALREDQRILLIFQFILFGILLTTYKHKDLQKYFRIEQIIVFVTLMLICVLQFLMIQFKSLKGLEYLIVLLMKSLILESFIVLIYDFFYNEHRVVEEIEIMDMDEKEDDLEKISLKDLTKKNQDIVRDEEFKTMSDQIY